MNAIRLSTATGTIGGVAKACYSQAQKTVDCDVYSLSSPIGPTSTYTCGSCISTHVLKTLNNGTLTCWPRVTGCPSAASYVQSQVQPGTFRCISCSNTGATATPPNAPRTPVYNADGITTKCVVTASITTIANCDAYSQVSSNIYQCKTCVSTYLLTTFSSLVYTPVTGTNLGTACINPIVDNCQDYYQNGANYYCRTCSGSFTLIYTLDGSLATATPTGTTKCVSSVANCLTYNLITNQCSSCKPSHPMYVKIKQAPYKSCIATLSRIQLCAVYTYDPTFSCDCFYTPQIGKFICSGSSFKCTVTSQYADRC